MSDLAYLALATFLFALACTALWLLDLPSQAKPTGDNEDIDQPPGEEPVLA